MKLATAFRTLIVLLAASLLTALAPTCVAQRSELEDSSLTVIRQKLQGASKADDAQQYASVFSENSRWHGPLGQNAIGPANIQRAISQVLADLGPLSPRVWTVGRLGPDVLMVEMFQGNDASAFGSTVSLAPGSGAPPKGSSLRSTLILKRVDGRWEIITAELADIRLREQRAQQ